MVQMDPEDGNVVVSRTHEGDTVAQLHSCALRVMSWMKLQVQEHVDAMEHGPERSLPACISRLSLLLTTRKTKQLHIADALSSYNLSGILHSGKVHSWGGGGCHNHHARLPFSVTQSTSYFSMHKPAHCVMAALTIGWLCNRWELENQNCYQIANWDHCEGISWTQQSNYLVFSKHN